MRRHLSMITAVALAAGAAVPAAIAAASPSGPAPAVYLAGGGVESIKPTAAMLANDDFYLGGFGFGDFKVGNEVQIPSTSGRFAAGVLGTGPQTRAFALSDHAHTIVLAQIETQGYFAAYKQGPFGENEIRKDAATKLATLATSTHPAPTASEIVVDSDHTHGGADTVGVWGGVPTSYLKMVHDETVQAIVDAWTAMKPATLTFGVAHAGVNGEAQYLPSDSSNPDWILNNQYNDDPNNQTMDDEIRVIQAKDPGSHKVLDTYINYGAHPDVLGSDNTLVTGDYVTSTNALMEKDFGGFAMDQVSTLGREQPNREGCKLTGEPSDAQCQLDSYAVGLVRKVKEALAVSKPLTGAPIVAMNSYLMQEPATSAVLIGVTYAGTVVGVPAARAVNAPWAEGNTIGTTYFVGRIGDILVTGGPGEMYAQIWQKVKDTVTGVRDVMNIGTAGDFLGYIIAPLEAYPQPIRESMFSGGPSGDTCTDPTGTVSEHSPVGCPDPIGNDNYFFNIGTDFGERLTCDFLRGAGDILTGDPQTYWKDYDRCPAFASDLALPEGLDTQFPEQPDLSSVLTHL